MANKAIQEMIKATVPQYVHEVIHFLKHGMHGSVYLVGGCVRDMFRGIKPMDYDLATDLTPDTIIDYFTSHYRNSDLSAMQWSVVDTGSKYGTVTIVCKFYGRAGESSGGLGRLRPATIDLNNLLATHHVEVTTFRTDGKYSDGRRPDEVTFGSSLNLDLARRDFTMNAMAIDPINFELIDPYNGQADIKVKNIRAVGDPNERIQEDALRMLRAVRFAARLGFYLYPSLCDAIKHNAHLIANVSPERVQSELVKMLLSCEPGIAMSLLKELGLMMVKSCRPIFP
jgi:tRNA nucleotidyltransferase (CCA-adding enzyme)